MCVPRSCSGYLSLKTSILMNFHKTSHVLYTVCRVEVVNIEVFAMAK